MVALGLRGILLGLRRFADTVEENNLLRICLVLAGLVFCFPHPGAASNTPERPAVQRKVTTVGVDPQTGRLVRVRPTSVNAAGVVTSPSRSASSLLKSEALKKRVAKARQTASQTQDVASGVIRDMIDETAKRHGVDPALVHSVIKVESNYQQKAISPKGAQGLMQLIPATARRFGVANPFDPSQNLEGGVKYLRYLTERFGGDLRLALAAYNAGEGAVDRHQGIPPYQETQQYVTKITRILNNVGPASEGQSTTVSGSPERFGQTAAALASVTQTQPSAPPPQPLRVFTDADGRWHIETVSAP
jgi:hypothetical protein